MKLPRRQFLNLTAGAVALPAVSHGIEQRPIGLSFTAAIGGAADFLHIDRPVT